MGITNLLPQLEKSSRQCNVSEFRGHTMAIDAYCWLHRGAIGCALQLAKGEDSTVYVKYCMKLVNLLVSNNIKPIMVFDGQRLPAKAATENQRSENRKAAKKQGMSLLKLGKADEAYKHFRSSISVTPAMSLAVRKECRKLNVDCIVAPFEADAQLAFLSLNGVADCIISEDSDLLSFGCKKVLYKMDLNGNGTLVEADKLYMSMNMKPEQFTLSKFRHMCILAGCDYLSSLEGIGIKKAMKFIKMTAETDPIIFLDKLPRYLNLGKLNITPEYKNDFLMADATFKHQIVFDPFKRELVTLTPVQEDDVKYCYNAGSKFDAQEACQMALGNLNPRTKEKMDNFEANEKTTDEHSIWRSAYKARPVLALKAADMNIKFNAAKTVVKNVTAVKHIEDRRLDDEIEVYFKKQLPEQETSQPQKEETIDTHPVLNDASNNPFAKTKFSKFTVTETNGDHQIVSRFFNSAKEACHDDNYAEPLETTIQSSPSQSSPSPVFMVKCEIKVEERIITFDENERPIRRIEEPPAAKKIKLQLPQLPRPKKQANLMTLFAKMNSR